jgi:hypothetical protein
MKALALLSVLIVTGCSTALHSKSELYHRAYLPKELGMFYYTGSTDSLHRFLKTRFLRLDKRFTLPKSEIEFRSELRSPADRSQWLYLTFSYGQLSLHGDRAGMGFGVVETIDFETNRLPNQGGAANGSQPFRSEMNRTSSTAGSRR